MTFSLYWELYFSEVKAGTLEYFFLTHLGHDTARFLLLLAWLRVRVSAGGIMLPLRRPDSPSQD
jgi:hypothetical protein